MYPISVKLLPVVGWLILMLPVSSVGAEAGFEYVPQWTVYRDESGSSYNDWMHVATDPSGKAFVAGRMRDAGGQNQLVVAKYDTFGTELWSSVQGGPSTNVLGIAVDPTNNRVFVARTSAAQGSVLAFRADTGALLWNKILPPLDVMAFRDGYDPLWIGYHSENQARLRKISPATGSTISDALAFSAPVGQTASLTHLAVEATGSVLAAAAASGGGGAIARMTVSGTIAWSRQIPFGAKCRGLFLAKSAVTAVEYLTAATGGLLGDGSANSVFRMRTDHGSVTARSSFWDREVLQIAPGQLDSVAFYSRLKDGTHDLGFVRPESSEFSDYVHRMPNAYPPGIMNTTVDGLAHIGLEYEFNAHMEGLQNLLTGDGTGLAARDGIAWPRPSVNSSGVRDIEGGADGNLYLAGVEDSRAFLRRVTLALRANDDKLSFSSSSDTLSAPSGALTLNDTGATGSVATLQTQATHGVVSVGDDGSFVYSAGPSFTGQDSFSYRLEKGASTSIAAVSIIRERFKIRLDPFPTLTGQSANIAPAGGPFAILLSLTEPLAKGQDFHVSASPPGHLAYDVTPYGYARAKEIRILGQAALVSAAKTVTLTASEVPSAGAAKTLNILIVPATVSSITSATDLVLSDAAVMSATINLPMPAGKALRLPIWLDNVLTGRSILIPAGATSGNDYVPTYALGTHTVKVGYEGISKAISIQVRPTPKLVSVGTAPTLKGGLSGTFTVRLDSAAGAEPQTVLNSSSSPLVTIPNAIVAPGKLAKTVAFSTQPVSVPTNVTLTAKHYSVYRSATVRLDP